MKFLNFVLLIFSLIFVSNYSYANQELKRPKINTPISEKELLVVLESSHKKVFGKMPTKNRLFSAWAQTALETGRGALVCNRNIANIGANKGQLFYKVSTHKYRHFMSIEESAIAYWNVIRKCSSALRSFDDGDIKNATLSLKRCRYFDADEKIYGKIMQSLFLLAYSKFSSLYEQNY